MSESEITAALERSLVRELLAQWKHVNASYFRSGLRPPAIEITTSRTMLGRWMRESRTIEIARDLVLERPWGMVVEVLKHEMAHQYVHEILGAIDETAHGPAFREACRRLGIDARAAGLPDAVRAPSAEEHRVVERIARLLALAESPNVHEAEAATVAAQRLMLKHNLEARHAATAQDYGFRHLGKPSGRVGESERILAALLARHFFVEVIWVPVYRPREGKRGSVLEICGAASNLAIAEYVHAYLAHAAEQLWSEHKKSHGVRGNRDRRTFLAGVMAGFAEKLRLDQQGHAKAGLVWVADGDLVSYYRRRHPHVRNVRLAGTRKNEAFGHGREAGKRIILRRGVGAAAAGGGHLPSSNAPRLLPARGRTS
jgi:nitroreductase